MSSVFLKLHSCCIPVKGASRSAICDLQRGEVYFIPNVLHDLFVNEFNAFDIEALRSELNAGEIEILNEYVAYVLGNELGWICDEAELLLFPLLDSNWEFPAHISNCIVDVGEKIWCTDPVFLKQLEALCCNFIQVRFFRDVSLPELQDVLDILNPTQIKAIEISIPFIEMTDFEKSVLAFAHQNRKVRNITIFAAPQNAIIKREDVEVGSIFMTKKDTSSHLHCGIVEFEQFSINIPHYTESLKYNSCLNRKIGIDIKGNIKNCPSMVETFGNLRNTTLAEAIENPGVKKYWNITKDQISKCKDCEFRYICTDCRAYLDNPDDSYSAPLKCGYDPYTNKWDNWSTHPLKEAGVAYYNLNNTLN